MKLSIIIPIYNGSRYLNTLFDCLNSQTCMDYEAVFIDDGSTDDTRSQYESMCRKYPKVYAEFYSKQNGGVSSARNLGIKKATGDVISFCDVDDRISSCYVDYVLQTMEKTNSDLVFWRFNYCKKAIPDDGNVKPLEFSVPDKEKVLEDNLYKKIVLCCGSCAIKAEVIDRNNLCYEETAKYSEDSNFIWKMLCSSKTFTSIENVLYYYMIHADSAMGKFDEERVEGYRIALELIDFVYKKAPDFGSLYEQYEGPRLLWSMAWQAAQSLTRKDFFCFFEKFPILKAMRTLRDYQRNVTRLSARLYLLSPDLFRLSSKLYGHMKK